MQIHKDKISGIFFILVGLFFGYHSLNYEIGNVRDIATGFFPFWISVLSIVIGTIILLLGFRNDEKISVELKTPLYILTILVAFIFVFKYTGFLIAGIFLIWSSAVVHKDFSVSGTLIVSVIYAIIIILLKYFILNSLPL
jgi:hypothetical protein